jgi:8-oxo-dGTP pyrophosphatase MutT (NUDIX family)
MDLSIMVEDITLYIRVAAIVKTERGYLFEKSRHGYVYTAGGKVKINESSLEAVKREIVEELGVSIENFTLRSVLENFYTNNEEAIHEICFIYETEELFIGAVPEEFIVVSLDQIDNFDIRPKLISNLIRSADKTFRHVTVK